MTHADRTAEWLSVFAGAAFTAGLTLLGLAGTTGSTVALIASLALLVPLTPVGLVVGWQASKRRAQALPRRYYDKPTVADPMIMGGGCGDVGDVIGW